MGRRGRGGGDHRTVSLFQPARINRIGSIVVTVEYDGTLRNPIRQWSRKDIALVVVADADGAVGVGECWIGGGSGAVLAAFLAHEVAPLLGGKPAAPRVVSRLLLDRAGPSGRPDLWSAAASGLDMALWDLAARRAGLPLYRMLGGGTPSAPVYASGGMYGLAPEALAEEARHALERHGGYKLKAGGASPEDDAARLAAIRKVAPDARLMVDFMFRPGYAEALMRLQRLAPFGLHFAESPTAIERPEDWGRLHALTGVSLSGPEIAAQPALHRQYLEHDACQVLQFDLALCGGISGGLDLVGLASGHGRPVALHCAGSAVVFAASAHLAAASEQADSVERHLLHTLFFDRLQASGFSFADGRVHLPEAPGLGFAGEPGDFGAIAWH
jgi:D-galactarolactone cycloisomerase